MILYHEVLILFYMVLYKSEVLRWRIIGIKRSSHVAAYLHQNSSIMNETPVQVEATIS